MDAKDTEQHIKDTAKIVFFAKGKLNAKTQEIADEAKVNRALLHYYFRSREKLFETVLKEALEESRNTFYKIASSDLSFEKKIYSIVSMMVDRMIEYPFMETFIVSEIIRKPENLLMIHNSGMNNEFKLKFKKEIQQYIDDHHLPHIKPEHFVANMLGMCVYPSVAKPILMNMFQYTEEQYSRFISERKKVIANLLLGKS